MISPDNPRVYGYTPTDRMRAAYDAANARLAAERGAVYASAGSGRFLASKTDLRNILRDAGLPRAAAEKIAAAGWPALNPSAAAAETAERIRAAANRMRR